MQQLNHLKICANLVLVEVTAFAELLVIDQLALANQTSLALHQIADQNVLRAASVISTKPV